MKEYHKIDSIYKRDEKGRMLFGQFSRPEFEYLKDLQWRFDEKIDGTNIRVMFEGGQFRFGGKTDNAQIQASLLNVLQNKFNDDLLDLFKSTFWEKGECDVCLYGEGYGAKIQKGGGNYRPDQGFILFDVQIGGWILKREDVLEIAEKFNIELVPSMGCGTLDAMCRIVEGQPTSHFGPFLAEGIVARPMVELKDRAGHRVITKIKHKDFNQKG